MYLACILAIVNKEGNLLLKTDERRLEFMLTLDKMPNTDHYFNMQKFDLWAKHFESYSSF